MRTHDLCSEQKGDFSSPELKANRRAYEICMLWHPSSSFTFFKRPCKTARPIKAKLHVEHPYDGGTKCYIHVYLKGPDHMTRVAARPSSPSLEPLDRFQRNRVCSI